MHYLSVLGHTLQTKNKLELAVLKHLQGIDRLLVSAEYLAQHKRTISHSVFSLNIDHPRCKKVECNWWQPSYGTGKDWVLELPFAKMWFYAEKV